MNYIMFDLDGTLLPMDMEAFIEAYFGIISQKLVLCKLEPKKIIKGIGKGMEAMVLNDGSLTNELAFWQAFEKETALLRNKMEPIFEDFYKNDFEMLKDVCPCNKLSNDIVKLLKNKGYKLVLATNPIFPRIATMNRIKWAGLDINDFELVTTYENCSHSKPSVDYYKDILNKLNINADECMMVGNDTKEDMEPCCSLGIKVVLIKDHLINRDNKDLDGSLIYSLSEFKEYISKM